MNEASSQVSFVDLREQLHAAADWYGSFAPLPGASRVVGYCRSLDALVAAWQSDDFETIRHQQLEFDNALVEAHELVGVHAALGTSEHRAFVESRIARVVEGPLRATDEQHGNSSNAARNTMFELALAARLVSGGATLDPQATCDVGFQVDGRSVLVECKRPMVHTAVAKRFREAAKQLRKGYQSTRAIGARGLIAIDITRAGNPDARKLEAENERDIGTLLDKVLDSFAEGDAELWNDVRDKKTIGLLVRIGAMFVVRSAGRYSCAQQWMFALRPQLQGSNRSLADSVSSVFVRALGTDRGVA